jgi:hypothetical protein
MNNFPLSFSLKDGTHVLVNELDPEVYEFHLTRLNSEKYNFTWSTRDDAPEINDNYELRFTGMEREAVQLFTGLMNEPQP